MMLVIAITDRTAHPASRRAADSFRSRRHSSPSRQRGSIGTPEMRWLRIDIRTTCFAPAMVWSTAFTLASVLVSGPVQSSDRLLGTSGQSCGALELAGVAQVGHRRQCVEIQRRPVRRRRSPARRSRRSPAQRSGRRAITRSGQLGSARRDDKLCAAAPSDSADGR